MAIVDWLTSISIDWNNFWNTLLATVAGAVIALVFSMWLTRRERPRPIWRLEDVTGHFQEVVEGYAGSLARVVNIGNGDAHNVRITIDGAPPYQAPKTIPLVHPGESAPAGFCFAVTGEYFPDEEDKREPVWPDNARVTVEWQQPPSFRKTKRQVLSVGPLPQDWDSQKRWPADGWL